MPPILYCRVPGCETFDFAQGSEDYKYSFGAQDRLSPSFIVDRKSLRLTLRKLRRKLRSFAMKRG